ncbi:oligosaccharide flippase family protein [Pseudogracilibacillus sp. SO30301A]|uniref:oligosaccharide flippase family protein n=1 Tax=Pseudogracilibacillus sp. SO30301A TaxID=3098291 RepID=UPI00300E374E
MMNKKEKLLNDTILYGIANFGSSALTFLMLPLYTRYFTPKDFGTWDLAITTITLLIPFITFELTAATYRWLLDKQTNYSIQTIISTGFIQVLRHSLLFNLLAILLFFFSNFSYKWEALLLLNVMIFSSFVQQCARGLGHNRLFATLGIIQTSIVISLNLLFILYFKLGIEALFYANSIAGICIIILACYRMNFIQYLLNSSVSWTLLKDYLAYAIPIIPAAASWWVMTMADRWIIATFLGVSANGIYAIAIKIPAVLLIINSVFSLAWKDSAILSFQAKDKDSFFSKTYEYYFRLMATSVICLILIAKPAIRIFIGNEFFEAWKYSGFILIATLFHSLALFWSAGFHGAKKTTAILSTSIVGAVVNVVLNIFLIHYLGLYAVAISTLIAFFLTWIIRVWVAKELFTITFNKWDFLILFSIMFIALFIPFYAKKITLAVSIVGSVLLFFIYNRKLITSIWFAIIKR